MHGWWGGGLDETFGMLNVTSANEVESRGMKYLASLRWW